MIQKRKYTDQYWTQCQMLKCSLKRSTLSIWQMVTNTSSTLMLSCFCSFIFHLTNTVEYLHYAPHTRHASEPVFIWVLTHSHQFYTNKDCGQISIIIFMTCQLSQTAKLINVIMYSQSKPDETEKLIFYWIEKIWVAVRKMRGM